MTSANFLAADKTTGEGVSVAAPYMRLVGKPQNVTVHFYYPGYGNKSLMLIPRYCFTGHIDINGVDYDFPHEKNKWCRKMVIDVTDNLRPSDNVLKFSLDYNTNLPPRDVLGFSISQPLFNPLGLHSISAALLIAGSLAFLWELLGQLGFDTFMRSIFVAACAFYIQGFIYITHFSHGLDFEKHVNYIQFLSQHFFAPYDYRGQESWHPALYYWVAALIIKIVQWIGGLDIWDAVRLISLNSYLVFLYFGMRCIDRFHSGPIRNVTLCVLAFWPAGFLCSAWIYNDVFLYPFYAGCFYYTLIWYKENNEYALRNALFCLGIGFAIKSSSIIPLAIVACSALYARIDQKRPLRAIIARPTYAGWLVLALGIAFNGGRSLYYHWLDKPLPFEYLGGTGKFFFGWSSLLPRPLELINRPFFMSWDDPAIWDLHLRTILFSNVVWRDWKLGSAIMILFILMLIGIAVYSLTLKHKKVSALFPLLAGLIIPPLACFIHAFIFHHDASMDGRYVRPEIIAIVACYGFTMQKFKEVHRLLYYAAFTVSIVFCALSIIVFEIELYG